MNEIYSIQLEFIKTLQEIRTPLLDVFFKLLNYFDRQEFIFILIPTVWIGCYWKPGLRLFYTLTISGLLNNGLKQFFEYPRPFHLDPSLAVIKVGGYGFPSGAAQTSILLAALFLTYFKKRWHLVLALNFVFWISLSRLYLGVHVPTDILGGWAVGLFLFALYTYVRPLLESYFKTLSLEKLLFLSLAVPLIILSYSQDVAVLRLCSAAIGASIGVFVCCKNRWFLPYPKNKRTFILRTILGAGGIFALYAIEQRLPITKSMAYSFFQFSSLGLWLSLGATLVARRVFSRS